MATEHAGVDGKMLNSTERNNSTYVYATLTFSGLIVGVPVFSWSSSILRCESPSSTTTLEFLTRDPIGYYGGLGLYQHCMGGALFKLDPLGLDSVVGIDDGPPRKVIRMGVDDEFKDYCYVLVKGEKVTVPCPAFPPDDPEGPGYLSGIQDFDGIRGPMTEMCKKCCKKCTCEKDVNRLIAELIFQWQSHYRDSTGCHRHEVGGHYCWSWAWFFKQGIDSLGDMGCGFQANVMRATDPANEDADGVPVHYWVQLTMGDGGPDCSYWFDDGFTPSGSTVHQGIYPQGWGNPYPKIDPEINPPPERPPHPPYPPKKCSKA